ncbi:MAG: TlpA family protein disulfide reductase [Armatimonadetes bacterium]|nr:TlpA family protein disulfide reductase [Armatimonadota bacterium]
MKIPWKQLGKGGVLTFFALFLCITLVLPALVGCGPKPTTSGGASSSGPEGAREPFPDFSFPDSTGKSVGNANFKGKVVLINFWATWCKLCLLEIPHLKDLRDKFKGKPFEMVGIALDQGGWKDMNPFIKDLNMDYVILLGDKSFTAKKLGGLAGFPLVYIVDKKGNIYNKYIGYQEAFIGKMEKDIETLVAEK